jgi:NAD(P)-dependent dehydrogenase (short-subunit alcohol dehydrogenase family)
VEKLTGKTVLVTGSTDGVGRLVARRLGEAGARVLVHGRDAESGARVVADIEKAGGSATFFAADLGSLGEVCRLAAAVQDETNRLDILINNAGIGTAGGVRQESADGFERRFAVNYLAGFLLTSLLLPLLRSSAPARIVNVSSAGQQAIDFADVMLTHGYSGARLLSEQAGAGHVHVSIWPKSSPAPALPPPAWHPATYMDTTMVRRAGITPVSTVDQGAEAIMNLAVASALEGQSGLYFSIRRGIDLCLVQPSRRAEVTATRHPPWRHPRQCHRPTATT